jgi:hypothetical protein
MSAPIMITISGPDSVDTLTVTQTIWQALNDACLEVAWPNGKPCFAVTTLYEQQTRFAMDSKRCMLTNDPLHFSEAIRMESMSTGQDRTKSPCSNLSES